MSTPLTVRLGKTFITGAVQGLQFRKEAVGGCRSISLRLAKPLTSVTDVQAFQRVRIFDARSAEVIADGHLADLGRSAGSDGQQWDLVAFGPGVRVADKMFPYIVVDTSLERWHRSIYSSKNATTQTDERSTGVPSLLTAAEEGKTVSITSPIWTGDWIYRAIREAGMKLGRVDTSYDAGVTDANYRQRIITRTGSGAGTAAADVGATTTGGTMAVVQTTHFTNGHDVAELLVTRGTSATTGAETHWFEWWGVAVRSLLMDESGTDRSAAYFSGPTARAHDIVRDLIGRHLSGVFQLGTLDTTGAYNVDQMAYLDGVTAETVLSDLMALEPAFRWSTSPAADAFSDAAKARLSWQAWPTSVRYEAALDDGGQFPASGQDLYNEVAVRWRNSRGSIMSTLRTGACPALDEAGMTRRALMDLGDEVGSAAAAARAGDAFLAAHKYPSNAGTLTINRPILDLERGALVLPHEIEPGELIRVRGVESYTDSLNASSNDGETVFRIWAATYNSDADSTELELDTYPRNTVAALRALASRRIRRR